eukprot:5555537-Pleurochrysis_carterae.AAC.1
MLNGSTGKRTAVEHGPTTYNVKAVGQSRESRAIELLRRTACMVPEPAASQGLNIFSCSIQD